MRTRHILLITAAAGLFSSCVKEPEQPNGGPGDGTATRITLSLTSDKQTGASPQAASKDALQAWNASGGLGTAGLGAIPGTRALTSEQEQSISNLHILVFDALGALVTNEHFDNLDIKDAGSVSLETLPGTDMQLWAVANGDVNDDTGDTPLDTELRAVTTLDELKALLVTVKGNGLNRADRLTMVGCDTVTITKPHVAKIPIQLHFLSAKVTISIKSNVPEGQSITIDNWDMVNIPQKTYLMERTNPNQDAVTAASDYITTTAKYRFDPKDELTETWSQAFYLFENRRGGRVERSDPSGDMYPDMGFGDQDQRGKAYYAPTYATYMLVYGTYTKDGRMNNVIYKIFLGENEINDYNIYRGKHYTYNVNINGLDSINIDTNVEWGSASFSVATSQDFQMDAHPDFRVLRIGGTAVDGTTPAYATVEVQETNGTPCEWLALSPLNLYRHGIKQATGENQQFTMGEGVGSYVRSKYIPLPTPESTFAAATFGMTRKLTKIPFDQPAIYTFQNVLVYADAYDGTADRSAKVHVTYYKGADGTDPVGELTYDITQSGPIKVSDSLYIERYEESAMLLHPGLASGFQNTTTMQWGYNTATLYAADDRFTNGNYLTANAVYNNVNTRDGMTPPKWTAAAYTDYREKYPRQGTQVVEPSPLPVSDNVYFYPEQTQATALTAYFHPIFNSSAARYCHEKNRDTDGDGIISADETVWYLPSFADMWYISKNMPEGVNLTGTYWTATEENNTNSWTYSFPAAPTSTSKNTSARVRCVRGIGAVLPDATMESTEDDKTKITLAATAEVAGAFNITDQTALPWTATINPEATWLQLATAADGTGAKTTVTDNGNKTLYAYTATANSSPITARNATITLTRPGMAPESLISIDVSQSFDNPLSTVTPSFITLKYTAGSSVKFDIDNKLTELEWTITVDPEAQSWLQIATSADGSDAANSTSGKSDATLYAYASSENPSEQEERIGKITFARVAQTNIEVKVTQESNIRIVKPATAWAGCNVYWDANTMNDDGTQGRLTFDNADDNTHAKYQGVFFKWGSLIAINNYPTYSNSGSIVYNPTGVVQIPYKEIPYCDGATNGDIPTNRAYLLEMHNETKLIGDICKHIQDKGWAPSLQPGQRWRMPTEEDLVADREPWAPTAPWTSTTSSGIHGKCIMNNSLTKQNLPTYEVPASGYLDSDGTMLAERFRTIIPASTPWTSTRAPDLGRIVGGQVRSYEWMPKTNKIIEYMRWHTNCTIATPVRCVRE